MKDANPLVRNLGAAVQRQDITALQGRALQQEAARFLAKARSSKRGDLAAGNQSRAGFHAGNSTDKEHARKNGRAEVLERWRRFQWLERSSR